MQTTDDFNDLIELHDDIKDFKTKVAKKVLLNFFQKVVQDNKSCRAKFTKIGSYNTESDQEILKRLNLSSTATCAYTLGEYLPLWEETNQKDGDSVFFSSIAYWNYILAGLKKSKITEIQLPDQFSILNILSLLKKIQLRIDNQLEKIGNGIGKQDNTLCAEGH